MTQKTVRARKLLVPEYMNDFSCIGSSCEDSCCIGWRVDIDEHTYKQYKKSSDVELKPLFEKKVTRQRSNSSTTSYAKIQMGEGGRCSFLSEDNLCKVQLTLGEELLSNTCKVYPRTINKINEVVEKSVTMSCPEAARLVLLNPKGIDFEEKEEPADTPGFIVKQLITDDPKLSKKPLKYFWELRIFSIQVLQNQSYTLAERLIILGLFFQKAQEQIDQGLVQEIPNTIAKYTHWMENLELKELLDDVPTQLAVQMVLCKELVDVRFSQSITSTRYLECLTEMLLGIQYTNEATVVEITENYKIAYEEFYQPFMNKHEYILENYLVNYVFKNLFPLGHKTLFDDYVMLVIHYSMIKLHLIGMASFHKGLSNELVIKLIQSFSKTVEHNNAYLQKILNVLKDNDFTTMPYMSILVKN